MDMIFHGGMSLITWSRAVHEQEKVKGYYIDIHPEQVSTVRM